MSIEEQKEMLRKEAHETSRKMAFADGWGEVKKKRPRIKPLKWVKIYENRDNNLH